MTDPYAQVSVRILDKEYQVACPASERTDLLDSAEVLNAKMLEIRDSGRVVGLDRIAVMAALNISHELLGLKVNETDQVPGSQSQFQRMDQKLDSALNRLKQLEI